MQNMSPSTSLASPNICLDNEIQALARDSSEESFNSKSFDNGDEMPFFIRNRRLFSWLHDC